MATAIICGALIIICFIGVRSSVKRIAHGCCGTGGDTVRKVKVKDKDRANYPYFYQIEVEGITCSNCKKRVENAFNEQGNFWANADVNGKKLEVYAKEELPEAELRSTIRKAGYQPGRLLTPKA